MAGDFDPYHKWLGIPPQERPLHHYRLLSLGLFEDNADVIQNAADRQMAHVRTFQGGPHSALSQKLLNELAAARVCLLDTRRRAEYDAELRAALAPPIAVPPAPTPPVAAAAPRAIVRPPPPRHVAAAPIQAGGMAVPATMPSAAPLELQLDLAGNSAAPTARRSENRLSVQLIAAAIGASMLAVLATVVYWLNTRGNSATAEVRRPPRQVDERAPLTGGTGGASRPTRSLGSSEGPRPAPNVRPAEPKKRADEAQPGSGPPTDAGRIGAEAIGAEGIDLLERVDLARDTVHGVWERDGNSVMARDVGHQGPDTTLLQVPVPPLPEEYVLTVAAERLQGDSALLLGLVCGGRQVSAVLDWKGISGLGELGNRFYSANQTTVTDKVVFQQAQTHTVTCLVRRRRISVYVDGQPLLDWAGDPELLGVISWWKVPDPRAMSIGVAYSDYKISRMHLAALPKDAKPSAEPDPPVHLIGLLDAQRDSVAGDWRLELPTLLSPKLPAARLQLPITPPTEYALMLSAQRIEGQGTLGLGIIVDGVQTLVALEGWNGEASGLHLLDGKEAVDNETTYRGKVLVPNVGTPIVCVVRKDRVRVICNNRSIIDWSGDARRLSNDPGFAVPDSRQLFLMTWDSSFKIWDISVTPLPPWPAPLAETIR